MRMNRLKNLMCLTLLLAVVALLVGCGADYSPVAPDETALTQAADSRLLLAFSPQASQRVAKLAQDPKARTSSELIGAKGGTVYIKDENGKGTKDNLVAILKVPADALVADELITMTVYGDKLSDLVVEFAPGGLEFLSPATLVLRLGLKLVDVSLHQAVQIKHIYHDGTVEDVEVIFAAEKRDGRIRMKVKVPGFSRYALGGGD